MTPQEVTDSCWGSSLVECGGQKGGQHIDFAAISLQGIELGECRVWDGVDLSCKMDISSTINDTASGLQMSSREV